MRFLPSGLVIHRWCARRDPAGLCEIGLSRDGRLSHLALPETIDAFHQMRLAAEAEGIGLHVIWGYRSSILQQEQFAEAEQTYGRGKGIRWLAPPGFSEHQTGWVLDIGDWSDPEADDNPLFERTAAFRWLKAHAGEYRFELSFPPGNWQGVGYEPWHWRFVGTIEAEQTFHPAGSHFIRVWGLSWAQALLRWLF